MRKCVICGATDHTTVNKFFANFAASKRFQQWSSIISKYIPNLPANKRSLFVCGDHFEQNDFSTSSAVLRLNKNAVPKLNMTSKVSQGRLVSSTNGTEGVLAASSARVEPEPSTSINNQFSQGRLVSSTNGTEGVLAASSARAEPEPSTSINDQVSQGRLVSSTNGTEGVLAASSARAEPEPSTSINDQVSQGRLVSSTNGTEGVLAASSARAEPEPSTSINDQVSQGRLVSTDCNEEGLSASSSEPGTSTVIHDKAMDLVAARTAKRTLQNCERHGSPKITKMDHTCMAYNRPDSYKDRYAEANSLFQKLFLHNDFGHVCDVCDRLWFRNDLTDATATHRSVHGEKINKVCRTCRNSLNKGNVPSLSKSNGFVYPDYPSHLPMLDPIVERIIAPRIPFMQIRRLRRDYGSYKIIGQVINVPVNVDETVQMLPRALDDDHAFNICIKKNLIHKSNYLSGYIKKGVIKQWLQYLIDTPLYRRYNITISDDFLSFPINETEEVELEDVHHSKDCDLLIGQQQTLLWNESQCLEIAPAHDRQPLSLIYDEHAEELSFPAIYLGCARTFKPELNVTPFMMATSEIRRRDRRGVTPQHILYMAMKILRLRVTAGLHATFKCVGNTANITRQMIEDREFTEQCVEKNLSFLKSIPNSIQYWSSRKKDLFAMMRQLGKPSIFLTMSANEIRWPVLLKTLEKLSRNGRQNIEDPLIELNALQRSTLVNEDPVICCIYFNKLVDVIMQILSNTHEGKNPFGRYRVLDYFKRIEFQHRGSPHAHILIWLANDPCEAISEEMPLTVQLITDLCSVTASDLPRTYSNQVHKHTFTCYKKTDKECRFNIPYWPIDKTIILLPLTKEDSRRKSLKTRATALRDALEKKNYDDLTEFLEDNNLTMSYYLDVLRATIQRPTIFFQRSMTELWTNTFNPWIANVLESNIDLQFILEEYSCAAYVVEYVNKTNRGISNLHRELIKLQEEYPDQDYTALLKRVSLKMLNAVEMSAQEAAWVLLRLPMSHCSREIIYIPTMWPHERTKCRKNSKTMEDQGLNPDSTDVWTLNIIQKYERRPETDEMNNICLAQFAASYTKQQQGDGYRRRVKDRVIRYRSYDMTLLTEYKREMVLLYVPFRDEHVEQIDCNNFLQIYDEHEDIIMQRRREFESNLDLDKTLEAIQKMCQDVGIRGAEDEAESRRQAFVKSIAVDGENNDDVLGVSAESCLPSIVRQRQNVMTKDEYCSAMRTTNTAQRDIILHALYGMNSGADRKALQIFFTGPAGCGKTFTLKLLMETYNRFVQTHNTQTNAYVACASTGKAAVAIGGTTVHSAFRITMSRCRESGLHQEALQNYRHAFACVRAVLIDEVSMIGADILDKINSRLTDITGEFDQPFGGMDIIFCGDLRQLPPVNARPIFKPHKNSLNNAILWQSLDYFPLTQVMRQSDIVFSGILTKVGNGEPLTAEENQLICERFRTKEWCRENVSSAVRLFHKNSDVDEYNTHAFKATVEYLAQDLYSGYKDQQQLTSARTKLHKLTVTETGGLPFLLRLRVGMQYMVTTNIDVEDGIVNGAIGELKYIDINSDDADRIWIQFDNENVGAKSRIKSRPLVASMPGVLEKHWTLVIKRHANIPISKLIKCRRFQFPVTPACALTIHKSQGGTFKEIVFNYDKSQEQQLVYVGLSRVTSLDGLYLTNNKNDFNFYHGKGSTVPKIIELRSELRRLNNHRLETISDLTRSFITNRTANGFVLMSHNIQSLKAHSMDMTSDAVMQMAELIALSETWTDNDETVNVNGFHCVTQTKRSGNRAGGVAIYLSDATNIEAHPHKVKKVGLEINDKYGDICAAEIRLNNTKLILFSVYITPNTSTANIHLFLLRNLEAYAPIASCSEIDMSAIPMILCGDFNLNVAKDENKQFIQFIKDKFNMDLYSGDASTTFGGSCLDMVFARHINGLLCKRFISYYSYHLPIFVIA